MIRSPRLTTEDRKFYPKLKAMEILQVAPALIASGACVPPEQALPLYVRDKVAKTTGERAVEKAAKASSSHSERASAAAPLILPAAHAPTPGT
jgi:tRNA threonylcarbamoyladenosine biosynthesis protein TsaB